MEMFELWSYDVNVEGLDEFAEQTYIRCRDNGQYFDCWGGHERPTIDDGVKGYWLSILAYGIHGDMGTFSVPLKQLFYSFWKATVYNPCY